jgi:hypothetical protein
MSIKNTRKLMIIGGVVVALLAGTVLLGNYTNILSGSSEPKTCQATKGTACSASQAVFASNTEAECPQKAGCDSVAKTCPLDSTKPCCAIEAKDCPAGCTKPCCAKECGADCKKPCWAEEAKSGCCPKSDASAAKTGCCPVASTTN